MKTSSPARILVVDDDPGILRLVSLILSGEGYVPIKAQGAEEGLGLVGNKVPPDLVVLDLEMPGMDGREFYKRARELGFSGPVLICSAFGAETARRELGADASIAKPFELQDMISSVNTLLMDV